METAETIRLVLQQNSWVISLDLKDAYFHVPIKKSFRKYLRFQFQGKTYQFCSLPFGLAPAPWIFTMIVKEVQVMVQSRGFTLHQYLDDWILRASSPEDLRRQRDRVLSLVSTLGFVINREKSELVPSQDFIFLGYRFLTRPQLVVPSPDRLCKLRTLVLMFLSQEFLPAQLWQSLLGLLAATEKMVPLGRLHMRPLQFCLQGQWSQSRDSPEDLVQIDQDSVEALVWWSQEENLLAGSPFRHPPPELHLFTDASTEGWGAHLNFREVAGIWHPPWLGLHINLLELALQKWLPQCRSKSVLIATDNSTVVSYVNKQGGDQVEVALRTRYSPSPMGQGRGDVPSCKAHTRQAECLGRCSITSGPNLASGMVTSSSRFPESVRSVGQTDGGFICHSVEQQVAHFCLPNPRSTGLERGCFDDGLAQSVRLCLSSDSPAEASSSQDQVVQVSDPIDSSTLAQPVLVRGPAGPIDRLSTSASDRRRSPQTTTLVTVSLPSGITTASRVAVIEQQLRNQGFSEFVSSRIAQPIRSSSLAIYESKWRAFCGWCDKRKADPFQASVIQIADFLSDKFQEGKALSTLAGYRTAITKTLAHFRSDNLSENPQLSALLKGFEIARPVTSPKFVEWDLALVLNALMQSPFEPLEKAHLKLLTWKTAFLVMLASARRGGEVHAFLHDRLRWGPRKEYVSLGVDPLFVAKSKLSTEALRAVRIPALGTSLEQSLQDDLVLCPVRALRIYLDRTRDIREGKARLFISYSKFKSGDITKATIASWVTKLIRLCYDLSPNTPSGPFKIRAHDIQAVAASMAFLRSVPLKNVMESASWASHNTFTSFYFQDLVEASERNSLSFVSALHCI